jgi:hypothetical protein
MTDARSIDSREGRQANPCSAHWWLAVLADWLPLIRARFGALSASRR